MLNEAAAEESPPLIDTHAHIFTCGLPMVPGTPHRFERDFSATDYIDTLAQNGVRYGVVVAPSFLGTYNAYTLAALERYKNLRATLIVAPDTPASEFRAWDDAGVRGIRLSLGNLETIPDLTTSEYKRLLRIIQDYDWHIHLFARPNDTVRIISQLIDTKVKFVIDHFGARGADCGPNTPVFEMILRALQTERAWVKLSAPYWSEGLNHKELAQRFLHHSGAERLLWGSDWPHTKLEEGLSFETCMGWLRDWIPETSDRVAMDAAAAKLYRITP